MSDKPEEKRKGFGISLDDKVEMNELFLTIPLTELSDNENMGEILARGFFDQMKDRVLQMIAIKRLKKQQSGIILPNAGNGDGLKVV